MLSQKSLSDKERRDGMYVLEQSMGFVWQAALRTAALLRVADHLKDEAKTAEQLAQELHVDAGFLYRVLRTLASREVFQMSDDGLFSLTPAAQFLRSDTPYSLREGVLMLTDKTMWQPAGEMTDIVKGKPVFNELFGMPFYEYWGTKKTPSGDDGFHAGMSSMSSVENDILVDHYDFPENATIVDIAGGLGNLLLTVLRRNPTLHGILFDRHNVLPENCLYLLDDDSRWETMAGSFFEACPTADVYMLKYILMDWPDDKASQILKTCRKAMKASSRLLILEPMIKEKDNEQGRYEMDLILLSGFDGGRARTEKEYAELLGNVGLKINRVIHTPSYLSIVEAALA